MPGTVPSDGPTVSLSFANNFWGKDDAGVAPLLTRMHNAKVTGEELKAFYSARAQLEEEYARKLLNLARRPFGSGEEGTLRMSLDVVRGETESMGKEHQIIAGKMKTELEEPLAAFTGGIKERRKIVQGGIEKLLKTKTQQTATVNKARDRFEQDCLKIKGYLAQGHMVMGQEERKNKAKLEKTQIQMSTNSTEYENAVKVLEETTGRWNREWKAACDKFQDLEEERLDFFKSSLWTYANIASTVCVSDDASCEKIRLSLEDCDVEKDVTGFIKQRGTGQDIPDPPKYINFCRGDIDDASSTHGSEDENYSVAQFQRTMNPAFRTASPQPSMFDSHNDPDSSLRDDLGIPKGRMSVDEDAFNPRTSQNSASVPPLASSQLSTGSGTHNPYADIPQVPHNPYPADGMTQFCRMGPPSERSTIPSPTRPASRDSHEDRSDYSAPTSFSSFDPASSAPSPTKQFNGSNISAASSVSETKQVQKKKSGFFSNSPFRRRSQKSKDPAPSTTSSTPTHRNTWTPANMPRETPGTSPTKPFGTSNRANTWQKQMSASPDGDPVDPRADYQLNIGNNVFDVAHPDGRTKTTRNRDSSIDMDPIAQALADLKSVTKQATVRESADRHYGMKTPAPPATPSDGTVPAPFASNASRSTPPPAYDMPSVSRLGAPQPAHTSREMQRTTERYVNQKREVFSTGVPSRPSSSMGRGQDPTRAPSPGPPRAASPRPYTNGEQRQPSYRAASPNPYATAQTGARPRAQSTSPIKHQPSHSGYSSRGGSPGYQGPRAASPNPAYSRQAPVNNNNRAPSSRGSDHGVAMALQLAPAGDGYGSQRMSRPQSQYYAGEGSYGAQSLGSRQRSQSAGTQRQTTRDGRPILHYARAMYMYQAAIPEELSFSKGDVLAVIRHQDDGWWEAEVSGQAGSAGLVPSNYLKNC